MERYFAFDLTRLIHVRNTTHEDKCDEKTRRLDALVKPDDFSCDPSPPSTCKLLARYFTAGVKTSSPALQEKYVSKFGKKWDVYC